jgi:hypothetical protein
VCPLLTWSWCWKGPGPRSCMAIVSWPRAQAYRKPFGIWICWIPSHPPPQHPAMKEHGMHGTESVHAARSSPKSGRLSSPRPSAIGARGLLKQRQSQSQSQLPPCMCARFRGRGLGRKEQEPFGEQVPTCVVVSAYPIMLRIPSQSASVV